MPFLIWDICLHGMKASNMSVRKGKFEVGEYTAGQQAVGNKGSSQHLVELTICFFPKEIKNEINRWS